MEFIQKIEKVIESGILSEGLSDISKNGATPIMIEKEEQSLQRILSDQHKTLLNRWNGVNLDYIRVLGVHATENEFIKELAKENKEWKEIVDDVPGSAIYFANDAGGFMYFELENGEIFQVDPDGPEDEVVAKDMDDFFNNYLFGERANEHMEGWYDELKEYGIV